MEKPTKNESTNRALDLFIAGGIKKEEPKTVEIKIDKTIKIFKKKIRIHLNFFYNIE